jgi:hypothetical protein
LHATFVQETKTEHEKDVDHSNMLTISPFKKTAPAYREMPRSYQKMPPSYQEMQSSSQAMPHPEQEMCDSRCASYVVLEVTKQNQ